MHPVGCQNHVICPDLQRLDCMNVVMPHSSLDDRPARTGSRPAMNHQCASREPVGDRQLHRGLQVKGHVQFWRPTRDDGRRRMARPATVASCGQHPAVAPAAARRAGHPRCRPRASPPGIPTTPPAPRPRSAAPARAPPTPDRKPTGNWSGVPTS